MLHANLLALFLLLLSSPGSAQNPRPGARVPGPLSPERSMPVVQREDPVPTVFEGFVLGPDGTPAEGAVVVTSAGGKAVTDCTGSFWLEVGVPSAADSVQLTAVGRGGKGLVATSSVSLGGALGQVRVGPLQLSSGTSCSPSWLPTFGAPGGMNGGVLALCAFDDGGGAALYAGGDFTSAGGVAANRIAKWDGSGWSALGGGMDDSVLSLSVFDDGGGPALYAGGLFASAGGVAADRIAKWDGSGWSALGSGMNSGVFAMAAFDDGGGPALYAGGGFTSAGGVASNRIAKWDGSGWSALGGGMNNTVLVLSVFDDGGGPALYAGGEFTTAGGVAANHIVRWNGSSWSALGGGARTPVRAFSVWNDGAGSALYAGGDLGFEWDGSDWWEASYVVKWNGSSLSDLVDWQGTIDVLAVFDDGTGPELYVGGPTNNGYGFLGRWDGSNSEVNGGPNGPVVALSTFDDGRGPALYAGGWFGSAGEVAANNIAMWDGSLAPAETDPSGWSPVGGGINGRINALAVLDDGGGPALYAGGHLAIAGGVEAMGVARWDGSTWSALGSGISGSWWWPGIAGPGSPPGVHALSVFDDGSGPALYAGGKFQTAGGVAANHIAKWNGSTWSALAGGLNGKVYALSVFDDGGGPALYAGGGFTTAGGVAANHIARWNGSSWSALGSGVNNEVDALSVFDDGSGPALYAGGWFTTAGGAASNHIAKWNGSGWSTLGSGLSRPYSSLNPHVSALSVFDDGGGAALFVGGDFVTAGGVVANGIARWNGSSWSALGSGLSGSSGFHPGVFALSVLDGDCGPSLYVGGDFTSAGGVAAASIAKWNGTGWSAPGSGMNGPVRALVAFGECSGPALYAGGDFAAAYDSGDAFLAKWGDETDRKPPVLSCPSVVYVKDRGSPGEIVTFSVPVTDCQDPAPEVLCVPPSGSFFPRGVTTVICTATDAAGNQSTGEFPVIVQVHPVRPR